MADAATDTTPKGSGLRASPETPAAPAKVTPKAPTKTDPPAPTADEVAALQSELTQLRERETARAEKVKTRNDERIKALPEKAQKAIAKLTAKLDPDEVADFLDNDLAELVPEAAATRPAGTVANGGKKVEEPIPAECTAEWERFGKNAGISERTWFEKNWKPRHPTKKT